MPRGQSGRQLVSAHPFSSKAESCEAGSGRSWGDTAPPDVQSARFDVRPRPAGASTALPQRYGPPRANPTLEIPAKVPAPCGAGTAGLGLGWPSCTWQKVHMALERHRSAVRTKAQGRQRPAACSQDPTEKLPGAATPPMRLGGLPCIARVRDFIIVPRLSSPASTNVCLISAMAHRAHLCSSRFGRR